MEYNYNMGTEPMFKRMTCPAPRRMSVESVAGMYYTVPWTVEAVKEYMSIGGWFHKGWHEFADVAAAKAAGVKMEVEAKPKPAPTLDEDSGLDRLMKSTGRLSRAERAMLLAKLS